MFFKGKHKFAFLCFFACALPLSAAKWSSQKLIPANNWVYKALVTLSKECKNTTITNQAPLTIAEARENLYALPYDELSDSGKELYEKLESYFETEYFSTPWEVFSAGTTLFSSFETQGATNAQTVNETWDYIHTYNNQKPIFQMPVYLSIFDFALIETELLLQENYWSINESSNWTNIPVSFGSGYTDADFYWPKTAYFSVGVPFKGVDFFNLHIGKTGLNIGSTRLDSTILDDDLETDVYAGFSLYSPRIRYEAEILQLEVNKYLYLHYINTRPTTWFSLGVTEGTLVNAPFELRYLNPLMVMHSFAAWYSYKDYNNGQDDGESETFMGGGESRISQHLGITMEVTPLKNWRIYLVYAQNELQLPSELQNDYGKSLSWSFGVQLGTDFSIPAFDNGYWHFGLEGLYSSPWNYMRFSRNTSFVRTRYDNMRNGSTPIYSWIGNQYGPDSICAELYFGYEKVQKWSAELSYLFLAKGENDTSLFLEYDEEGYYYYPGSYWGHEGKKYSSAQEAIDAAWLISPTGTPEFTNRVLLKGSYTFTDRIQTDASLGYVVILNSDHSYGTVEHGLLFSISGTFKIF